VATVVAGRVAAAVTEAAAVAKRSRIECTQLASGVRVITERMPEAHSACVGVWVGIGARDEPESLSGVSHFLEHLLFKGSDTRSARDIAQAIDRVGGDMNAFTAKEYTAYVTRLPSRHVELGIDLLADVLTQPSLRDDDIEAERQVILEELHMDEDTPEDRVHTLVFESLFPKHPLGRETAGSFDTVEGLAASDIRAFFAERYGPPAYVVAAAGLIEHDAIVGAVDARFGPAREVASVERTPPVSAARPLAALRRSIDQAHVAIGIRSLARNDPDREALEVLNHVLGGGMSSRLLQTIREDRGLAYAVYSAHTEFCDAGALTIYAATTPARVDSVLDLIDEELDRLLIDGITADELEVALGYLEGSLVLGLEDSGSRMSRLGGSLTVRGHVRTLDEQLGRYHAVTLEDVRRVAARVLTEPRSLAVVGPMPKRALSERLARTG
jgi:predicted Zn-dependent peptidase